MKGCSVEGCGNAHRGRGFCHKHLERFYRIGTPYLPSQEQRFWAKVERGPGCWEWLCGTNAYGYGRVRFNGRAQLAHRVAWQIENGPISNGAHVCHSCDNPLCVRPDHLWLGTAQDNMADMKAKGRQRRGEGKPNAVLTADLVRQIRQEHVHRCKKHGSLAIAKRLGLKHTAVYRAAMGITWRHIE